MTLRNYWKYFYQVIVIDFFSIIMNTHDYNSYCVSGISKWGIFYYLTVLVVEWCVTCLQFHSDRKWWPPSKKGTLYSTEAQNKVWQQNRKCKTWLLYIFFFIPPHVLRESGFRNQRNFCLWNPESWALESGIQLKEIGIPLTIRIWNKSSTDKDFNPVTGIPNPWCGI